MKTFKEYSWLFFLSYSFGSIILNGIVSDNEGSPIENANIVLLNTEFGSSTNNRGEFLINISEPAEIIFEVSHIGYEKFTDKINVYEDLFLNFELSKNVIDMKNVVVTGTKSETYIKDSPVLTHVISNEDIVNSSYNSLKDLLTEALPNTQTVPSDHTGDRVKMQGLDNKYMLFLVDGDRISAEYAGNINMSMFNVANIEKIEVVESSLSSLYGSSAISGVVNIITLKPKNKYRFGSLFSKDSYLTDSKTYYASFNFGNFYYDFTYMDRYSDGYDLTQTDINPFDYTLKPFEDEMSQFKMRYDVSSNANIEFLYKDYNSFIISYDDAIDNQSNSQVMILSDVLKKFTDNIYKIKFNQTFNQNSSIKLTLLNEVYDKINYYPYYYNESQYDLDLSPAEFISGGLEHQSVYFQYNKKINSHNLLGGIESIVDYYSSYNIYDKDGETSSYSIFEGIDQTKKEKQMSFFMHDSYQYEGSNTISYGIRYTKAVNFENKLVYSLSHKLSHKNGYNIRVNYSTGYRLPSLKELYYEYPEHFIPLYGNPNLRPTTSQNYSLSFDKRTDKNDFSIDLYMKGLEDFISTEYIDASLIYRNYDYVLINGLNMHYIRNFKNSSFKFVYNYTNLSSDSKEIQELISNHAFRLKYVQNIFSNMKIIFDARYMGEKFNFSQENDYVGLPSITILEPFWISDLMFIPVNNEKYRLKVGVKNLFNYKDSRRNFGEDLLNSYDPGRRIFVEASFNYKKDK